MITLILFLSLKEVYSLSGENVKEVKLIVKEAKAKNLEKWSNYLLENMPPVDLVNMNRELFFSHLTALRKNRDRIKWAKDIPDYVFYPYILPYSVAQEPLEDFSARYADTLYNLIKDCKNMKEAVFLINEWVYTKIQYKPTRPWDQNATTTIRRGYGRCEEETILLVKALRTVFIPARQAYSPRWPFTNSNHAWVEVWVDGKWHFIGGAELTELDHAWFALSAKRTAIVKAIAFGKVKKDRETIYKTLRGCTIVNSTENYGVYTDLVVKVLKDNKPVDSAEVSLSVYNYSSLSPVAVKYTDKKGYTKFRVGRADLFVYAYNDSLRSYIVYSPEKIRDTVVLNLRQVELPDTSFWLFNPRVKGEKKEVSYNPHFDTLKPIRELNFAKLQIMDSSVINLVKGDTKKLFEILYNAKGNAYSLLKFYNNLPDSLKEFFIKWAYVLEPKDIVTMDTEWIRKDMLACKRSLESLFSEDIPDSIVDNYLINHRILYERFAPWRDEIYKRFSDFRQYDVESTVNRFDKYIKKYLVAEDKRDCFGPAMNPLDVVKYGGGSELEKYIFMTGALRTLGIPARIKWNYKGVEYYDKEWKTWTLKEEEKQTEDRYLLLKFTKYGKDVTKDMKYYYDYSVTKFYEYPERLDPEENNLDSVISLRLEPGIFYVLAGWRNGYGDPYVMLRKVNMNKDTVKLTMEVGVPLEAIKPGDFIVRQYSKWDTEEYGIDLSKGKNLVMILDAEDEASYSTVTNALKEINNFKGRVFIFVKGKGSLKKYKKLIPEARVFHIDEKTMKKYRIGTLPSVLLLKDGKAQFWIEGIYLELGQLIEKFKN